MPTVELRFTALPAHVRTARLLAAVLARRAGVDEALIDEVKLAVGEACARAVGIHQAHAAHEDVVMHLTDDNGSFAVTVRDLGPADADSAVEAMGAPLSDLTDLLSGNGAQMPSSFGLAVISGLVDNVEVARAEPGTVVRMTWGPTA